MTEAERQAFEQELAETPDLQEALNDERLIAAAMQQARAQELRDKMRQWEEGPADPPPAGELSTQKNKKWWPWLFGGGLLLSALLWLLWPSKPVVPPATPDQNPVRPEGGAPPPMVNQPESHPEKSHGTEIHDQKKHDNRMALNEAVQSPYGYYDLSSDYTKRGGPAQNAGAGEKVAALDCLKRSDYSGALGHLSKLDSTDTMVRALRAHALFKSGRYNEAAVVFRSLANSSTFGAEARWNVLMCYFAQYPAKKAEYERELEQLRQDSDYPSLRTRAIEWQQLVEKNLR